MMAKRMGYRGSDPTAPKAIGRIYRQEEWKKRQALSNRKRLLLAEKPLGNKDICTGEEIKRQEGAFLTAGRRKNSNGNVD